jgi:hypothetical protein
MRTPRWIGPSSRCWMHLGPPAFNTAACCGHGPLSHLANAGCRVSLCFWLLAFLPCTTSIKPAILLLPRHCLPPRSAVDFLSTTSALWNAPGGTVFPKKQELRSYRQTKMAGQLNQNRPAKQAWSWAKFNFFKIHFSGKNKESVGGGQVFTP